jgi:hypothetical protein
MNSAAPSLERSIDRQLTAFITANVHDTVRGSTDYLIGVLDDEMVRTVADEIWATNSDTAVADAAALTEGSSLDDAVDAVVQTALHVVRTPLLTRVVTRLVEDFFRLHGQAVLREVLADLGITQALVAHEAAAVAAPFVVQAHRGGYLEARIRARLEPFYASWVDDGGERAPAADNEPARASKPAPASKRAPAAPAAPAAKAAKAARTRRQNPTKRDTA